MDDFILIDKLDEGVCKNLIHIFNSHPDKHFPGDHPEHNLPTTHTGRNESHPV